MYPNMKKFEEAVRAFDENKLEEIHRSKDDGSDNLYISKGYNWWTKQWTMEIAKCLRMGTNYYLGTPETPKVNRSRRESDIIIRASEKTYMAQEISKILDHADIIIMGEAAYGLDFELIRHLKPWKKIISWDIVNYDLFLDKYFAEFDHEFIKSSTYDLDLTQFNQYNAILIYNRPTLRYPTVTPNPGGGPIGKSWNTPLEFARKFDKEKIKCIINGRKLEDCLREDELSRLSAEELQAAQ